jgi:flavin reductase (DIM6/NTAB) family NADH-FMN oxidoreductase RutF
MSVRFRTTAATYPTGVTVLSTVADGQPHGMTVNSFASISIDPLLVLVSVTSDSRTYESIERSGVFAVTVLSEGQRQVAKWFADSKRPVGAESFAGLSWKPAPHSRSPILLDGISYFDCVVDQVHVAGDHTMVVGEVRAFDVLSQRPPLLFVGSRFTELRE